MYDAHMIRASQCSATETTGARLNRTHFLYISFSVLPASAVCRCLSFESVISSRRTFFLLADRLTSRKVFNRRKPMSDRSVVICFWIRKHRECSRVTRNKDIMAKLGLLFIAAFCLVQVSSRRHLIRVVCCVFGARLRFWLDQILNYGILVFDLNFFVRSTVWLRWNIYVV